MDLIDKKIICKLDQDCRQPISKIAKKLRIGRNVVDYRIKNLEKEGIIKNYVTTVNLGELGYTLYKVFLKIWNGTDSENKFVEDLKEKKEIINFLKVEGSFDYSIAIATKNVSELDTFIIDLKNKYKNLIKDYHITILVYSKVFKLNKLLLNQKENLLKIEEYKPSEKITELDEKDKLILKELSTNARLSIMELYKKTGLSVDTIKYRLKQLQSSLIKSCNSTLNFNKLGYYNYIIKVRIRQATKKEEQRLLTWCEFKNNVLFCTKRIGYYDFSIDFAVKSIQEFNKTLEEFKSIFGSIIDHYDVVIQSKVLRLNFVPF